MCEADVNLSARLDSSKQQSQQQVTLCFFMVKWSSRAEQKHSMKYKSALEKWPKKKATRPAIFSLISRYSLCERKPAKLNDCRGMCQGERKEASGWMLIVSLYRTDHMSQSKALSLLATINFCIYCEMKFLKRRNRKILKLKDLFVECALCIVWSSLDVRGAQEDGKVF